jgi:hypothetical protein
VPNAEKNYKSLRSEVYVFNFKFEAIEFTFDASKYIGQIDKKIKKVTSNNLENISKLNLMSITPEGDLEITFQ